MKKILILFLFTLFTTLAYASQPVAYCLVAPPGNVNGGYCTEGLDGKGKCVKPYIEDAPKCSADQPNTNQSNNN